jgi:LemA protein
VIWIIVTAVVVGLLVVGVIVSYNRFVSQRNLVQESWRQVDVELHRRYDLIPNLVATVQGYATHERSVFDEIARLRSSAAGAGDDGGLAGRAKQESALTGALRQLFAVVENYPVLKADQNFLSLQQQLSETEDRIAAGRRFYNANVRAYNTRIEAFPSNLVASQFRFAKAEYFEVEEVEVRAAPAVNFTGNPGGAVATTGTAPVAGTQASPPPNWPGDSQRPGQHPQAGAPE